MRLPCSLNFFPTPRVCEAARRHRGRLRKAEKLPSDAHFEMTHFQETDPRADKALHDSVSAVDRAVRSVDKAIADDRSDDNPANQ